MPDRVFIARLFLIGGGLLAIAGLLLGFILPIAPMFPPYLVTASLALAYGILSLWFGRASSPGVTKP
jgi:hypothetical protein